MDKIRASQVLISVKKTLDKHSIPFFLDHGTCLGAIREGDFIDGDTDIDLGVLYENFRDIEFPGFRKIRVSKPFRKVRMLKLYQDDIHLDIATYMKSGDKRFNQSSIRDFAVVHPAYILENYEKVEFCGEIFNVPSPVDQHLTNEYGNWRKVEPKIPSWNSNHPGFLRKISKTLGYL